MIEIVVCFYKKLVFLDYFNLLFAIYSLLDEADFSRLMCQNSR